MAEFVGITLVGVRAGHTVPITVRPPKADMYICEVRWPTEINFTLAAIVQSQNGAVIPIDDQQRYGEFVLAPIPTDLEARLRKIFFTMDSLSVCEY